MHSELAVACLPFDVVPFASPAKLDHFKAVLTQDSETPLAIRKHCDYPNPCPFKEDCWQHIPDVSIFTIPRLDWKKKDALMTQGIWAIADLLPGYCLTDNQQAYIDTVLASQPAIDQDAIAAALTQLEYPIHFFDFEAQNPAIPRFDGLTIVRTVFREKNRLGRQKATSFSKV